MRKYLQQSIAGYSIVETLIYLGLFVLISAVAINALLNVVKIFPDIRSNRDLLDSGYTAMERMTREIRGAVSIDTANSTLGTSPGVLQLNTLDSNGSAKTVKFTTSGNVLKLYENGVLSGNLIGQNTTVSSLTFTQITTTRGTKAVKIAMTLSDSRSRTPLLKDFYDTIILRDTY